MRTRLLTLLLAGTVVQVTTASAATIPLSNAGFETGSLSGWTAVVPSGGSAGAATVGLGGVVPLTGTYMADLKTDGPGSFTTLSQSVFLSAGDTVAGFANYYAAEFSTFFLDPGFIRIFDSSLVFVAQVFYADTTTVCCATATGWIPWSFTATASDTYTVTAFIGNSLDSVVDSHLYLDVPEPATLLLLGTGLAAAGAQRRRNRVQARA